MTNQDKLPRYLREAKARPDPEDLPRFLRIIAEERRKDRRPPRLSITDRSPRDTTAWARKALEDELATLAAQTEGGRNDQLNRSAFNLFQLVAGGRLDYDDTWQALYDTACSTGLSSGEVAATLRSGSRAGLVKPRSPNPPGGEELLPPVTVLSEVIEDVADRDAGASEAAYAFTVAVESEAYRLRVLTAAREKVAAEQAAATPAPPFDADLLGDVLARPADPPHRVEGLIPTDAGTLVVAQRKIGKTTLMLNLARSLLTGEEFLGRFAVRPTTGRVALLNFEVSAAQVARWADEVAVPRDRLYLVTLRGRRNPLGHPGDRDHLADRLREQEVEALMVDPFGRAYTGQSQNDPGEVGAWLAELDRFTRGEGIADLILATHAGWNGERTRGASALEDWADSILTMSRDKDDEQTRYLRAEGRDVLVEEDRLDFDPSTRQLTLTGAGSRRAASKARKLEQLVPTVVSVVTESPGLTGYKLEQELRARNVSFQKGDGSKAASLAVDRGLLDSTTGSRNSCLFLPR